MRASSGRQLGAHSVHPLLRLAAHAGHCTQPWHLSSTAVRHAAKPACGDIRSTYLSPSALCSLAGAASEAGQGSCSTCLTRQ